MYDEIYLENDEEVTSAVERIKKSKKKNIALVLPRNSVLGQSVVNLKLIFKEAAASGKEIGLVTPDTTTRNLAQRVGFSAFASINDIDFPKLPANAKTSDKDDTEDEKPAKKNEAAEDETLKDQKEDTKEDESDSAEADLVSNGFVSHSLEGVAPIKAEKEEPAPEEESLPPVKETTVPANKPMVERGAMIPSKGNLRFFRAKKRRPLLIPFIVGLALLFVGSAVAAAYIPSATVKLTLNAQPFNETVKSTIDVDATAVDATKASIPGKAISLDVVTKSSAKATGKKDIGTKSSGTVTITNQWDSSTHTFATGTKILAKNGNVYLLTADAVVPGATSTVSGGQVTITGGKKDVTVEASDAGDGYNIGPSSFTIPSLSAAQQEKIFATSATTFTGGTSNVVTVVTQSDIDKLGDAIKKQNSDDAVGKIKTQAGDKVAIDKAIQTVGQSVTSSVQADAQADNVEDTVTGTFKVIVFSKDDHKKLLEKLLQDKIPQGEKLVSAGEGVSVDLTQYDLNTVSDKTLELSNNLKAFTITSFDEAALKRDLLGTKFSDVQSVAAKRVPLDKIEYKVSPPWFPRMPLTASKITVQYAYKAKVDTTAPADKPAQ